MNQVRHSINMKKWNPFYQNEKLYYKFKPILLLLFVSSASLQLQWSKQHYQEVKINRETKIHLLNENIKQLKRKLNIKDIDEKSNNIKDSEKEFTLTKLIPKEIGEKQEIKLPKGGYFL